MAMHPRTSTVRIKKTTLAETTTLVEVPVIDGLLDTNEITEHLQELGFRPDDEIGIVARLVPECVAFRMRTDVLGARDSSRRHDEVVYHRAHSNLFDCLGTKPPKHDILGLGPGGVYTLVRLTSVVIVRLGDVVDDYEEIGEDK